MRQMGRMNPITLKLILMTMFGSAGMAALTLRATGSILLAFLTYSIGGAALMLLLAGLVVWRMGGKMHATGANLADWEQDRRAELEAKQPAPPREEKRRTG